jgi:hypothetical protein
MQQIKENNTPHIVQILIHGWTSTKKKRYEIKREIDLN